MGKNVVITESAFKSLLSEEVSKLMMFSKALDIVKGLPEDIILSRLTRKKKSVRYILWATDEEDLNCNEKKYEGALTFNEVCDLLTDAGFKLKRRSRSLSTFVNECGVTAEVEHGRIAYSMSSEYAVGRLKDRDDVKSFGYVGLWVECDGGLFRK